MITALIVIAAIILFICLLPFIIAGLLWLAGLILFVFVALVSIYEAVFGR